MNLVIFRRRVAGLTEAALSRFVTKASRAASLEGTSSPVVHLTPDVPGVYTARVVVSQGLLSAFASIRLSAR